MGGAISSGPISASPVKREFNVNFLPLQKKTMTIFGALGLGYGPGLGWQAKEGGAYGGRTYFKRTNQRELRPVT